MNAFIVNIDGRQVVVIAENISEVDRKLSEIGLGAYYEIESVISVVIL